MGVLTWVVAPAIKDSFGGAGNVPMAKALLTLITAGLIWQFALVAFLVWREQHTFRWSRLKDALWLRSPRSPRSGRIGGRVWLVVIPLMIAYAAVPFLAPRIAHADDRDFGSFLESDAGQSFMSGNWGWYALLLVLWVFNTVLGEELLFRGVLLPRMNGVFGRGDWVANGVLFGLYHVHVPWVIPETLLGDTLIVSYPAKRYRSAWIGIVVHSAQSVVLAAIVLTLVL
jgi:membrane protease YdiL (CAAX protease family)